MLGFSTFPHESNQTPCLEWLIWQKSDAKHFLHLYSLTYVIFATIIILAGRIWFISPIMTDTWCGSFSNTYRTCYKHMHFWKQFLDPVKLDVIILYDVVCLLACLLDNNNEGNILGHNGGVTIENNYNDGLPNPKSYGWADLDSRVPWWQLTGQAYDIESSNECQSSQGYTSLIYEAECHHKQWQVLAVSSCSPCAATTIMHDMVDV